MPGSSKRMDADSVWQSHWATHQVLYMAKRPSYELILTIPEDHSLFLGADQALLQLRIKDQHQVCDLVLKVDELEDFYAGLSQLVEYIKVEREKRSGHL